MTTEHASAIPPRPTAPQTRPTHPQLAAEHDRFVALLPHLLATIPGKYVAMHDGAVVAVADDEVEALTLAGERQPGVLHLVRLVTDKPIPVERLPLLRETVRG